MTRSLLLHCKAPNEELRSKRDAGAERGAVPKSAEKPKSIAIADISTWRAFVGVDGTFNSPNSFGRTRLVWRWSFGPSASVPLSSPKLWISVRPMVSYRFVKLDCLAIGDNSSSSLSPESMWNMTGALRGRRPPAGDFRRVLEWLECDFLILRARLAGDFGLLGASDSKNSAFKESGRTTAPNTRRRMRVGPDGLPSGEACEEDGDRRGDATSLTSSVLSSVPGTVRAGDGGAVGAARAAGTSSGAATGTGASAKLTLPSRLDARSGEVGGASTVGSPRGLTIGGAAAAASRRSGTG